MIIKRLTIIRQVNDAIEKVVTIDDGDDEGRENQVSYKRLVKVMNLCHIYIPIIHKKPNNSSQMSLDLNDLKELVRSKSHYKQFVDLQTESLEHIMKLHN